jgi:hypothetical protein
MFRETGAIKLPTPAWLACMRLCTFRQLLILLARNLDNGRVKGINSEEYQSPARKPVNVTASSLIRVLVRGFS